MQNIIIDDYQKLEERFFATFKDKNYFFEVTKCCGYSELVTCSKEDTLKRLHENISTVFGKTVKLYIVNESEKIWIPDSTDIKVKNFLKETPKLKPEYPLPSNIVYKVYLDDGACHINHYPKPVMPINVCISCRIHDK